MFAAGHTKSVTAIFGEKEVFVVLNFVVGIFTTRFESIIVSVRSKLVHFNKPSGVHIAFRRGRLYIGRSTVKFSREERNMPGIFTS
jgi:hypothetical protein